MHSLFNITLALFLSVTTASGVPEGERPAPAVPDAEKTKVIVEISNIRSEKGEIGIGVYTDQEGFENEDEYLSKTFPKSGLKNGKLTVALFLPPGTYGIALLDDENRDGEMNFGMVMPKEGFGFSNYYHSGLSRPDFEDFNFSVGSSTQSVKVKVKYM